MLNNLNEKKNIDINQLKSELEEFIGPTGFKYRDGGLLFPLNQETVNYNRIKECQKKLSMQDWKEQVLKLSLF